MNKYEVDISPKEIYTRHTNSMQITIEGIDLSMIQEIYMVSLCRIKTGNQVKEKYVLGEKTLRGEEISRVSPVKIEWIIEVTRKAPVSFSSSLLSIEYAARILIVEDKKQKMI